MSRLAFLIFLCMTLKRVRPAKFGLLVLGISASVCQTHAQDPSPAEYAFQIIKATYAFNLKRGAKQEVCKAYLKRLMATKFDAPPFCGIPEDSSVPGFTTLTRVPLTPGEVEHLYPRVLEFMMKGTQTLDDPSYATDTIAQEGSRLAKTLGEGWNAWRYSLPVSIQNNGAAPNIVVWQNPSFGECGYVSTVGPRAVLMMGEGQQVALVLSADNREVDVAQTKKLFGGKSAAKHVWYYGVPNAFAPLLDTFDVFEFAGRYYIAGFSDEEVERNLNEFRGTGPVMTGSLEVYIESNDQRERMCEYGMTGTVTEHSHIFAPSDSQ